MATSAAPISISQINSYYYVGEAMLSTIQQAVNFAVADGNSGTVIIPPEYAGTDNITAVTNGSASVYLFDGRNGQRQVYFWNGTQYVAGITGPFTVNGEGIFNSGVRVGMYLPSVASPQGIFDAVSNIDGSQHAMRLTSINPFDTAHGGAVEIRGYSEDTSVGVTYLGGIHNATVGVQVTIGANLIVTDDATINGDLTANSAEFDTCLVAMSPVRTFANTPDGPGEGMVWPDIGIPVSLGAAWQSPSINPTTLATWPASGIPVSTGSAWGTSLNPADLAHLSASNVFTGATQTINGNLTVNGHGYSTSISAGPSSTSPQMILDAVGNADGSNHAVRLVSINPSSTSYSGAIGLTGYSSNFSVSETYLTCVHTPALGVQVGVGGNLVASGNITCGNALLQMGNKSQSWSGVPNIKSDGTSLFLNPRSGGSIFLNVDAGVSVFVGTGITMNASTSSADFAGILTAGVKSFRITYPHDDTKHLTHSCIEGPEIAVYYRGEAETYDGVTTITLPHYFEGLTRKENRSVQLTELYDDEDDPLFGNFLAAGRIRDGKFNVRSSTPAVKFYWEVMAVRADVEELEVVTIKEPPIDRPQTPVNRPGVERSGTPQAGEPKPQAVRAGDAATTGSSRTRKPH